jgi:hypothetical protein
MDAKKLANASNSRSVNSNPELRLQNFKGRCLGTVFFAFVLKKSNDGRAPLLVPHRCRAEQKYVREVLVPQPTISVLFKCGRVSTLPSIQRKTNSLMPTQINRRVEKTIPVEDSALSFFAR